MSMLKEFKDKATRKNMALDKPTKSRQNTTWVGKDTNDEIFDWYKSMGLMSECRLRERVLELILRESKKGKEMKFTKQKLREMIRSTLLREADGDDDDDTYGMMQRYHDNIRNNPDHPANKPPVDKSPVDKSPEAQKMMADVETFAKTLGTPKQLGDRNRYDVEPVRGLEVSFIVQTKTNGKIVLKIQVSATGDYLPAGGAMDLEDLEDVADGMVKMSQVLKKIATSGLPARDVTIQKRM